MKYTHWLSWSGLCRNLRKQFLAGVLVTIPLGATILILAWIFTTIDNILQPVIRGILGYRVPGVGFVITIVLIYLVGVIASNVFGKRLIQYGESLLSRIPLVRPLYTGIKQLLDSFSKPGKSRFMQAVLVEFPRKGIWTMGFITNESSAESGEKRLNVFIPTSPNPTSGFLEIVKEDDIIRTNIPVDAALKMIISAGRVAPEEVSERLAERNK